MRFVKAAFIILLGMAGSVLAAQQQPNVLFIISDDLRNSLAAYGDPTAKTPNLDRLAAEGVRFERAYSQYPVCGPSRASIMSGLYPHRTKVLKNDRTLGSYRRLNPELAEHPSIGGFLRSLGYYSARVSKIYYMGDPGEPSQRRTGSAFLPGRRLRETPRTVGRTGKTVPTVPGSRNEAPIRA